MLAADFLREIWPSHGYYAIAIPFTPPGETKFSYTHRVARTVEDAVRIVESAKATNDIFFCIHSLAADKVWNPEKPNKVTGELGAYEHRTQKNMLAAKALFFDIDVGPEAHKYQSQAEAITALKQFTTTVGLPKPVIVSSGGGLHVYWKLAQEVSTSDWVPYAHKLKTLAIHHGLKVDPSRTTDVTSVLRVPGTFNYKNRQQPRPTQILANNAKAAALDDMMRTLDDALIVSGLPTTGPAPRAPAVASVLGSNTDAIHNAPPVSFAALLTACHQVKHVMKQGGDVPEPFWYATLGVVRYCAEGTKAAHYISKRSPNYSADVTDQKLHQMESKGVGPTTCARLEELNPGGCDSCPRKGKVKVPLSVARFHDFADPPVVPPPAELPDAKPLAVPSPPSPYMRLANGAIAQNVPNKKDPDESETVVILPYDFHPVRRMTDPVRIVETHLWRADLPKQGYTEIMIDADAMYDSKKLSSTLSHNGVFPQAGMMDFLRQYMVAYINLLQQQHTVETVHNTLGWTDDYSAFVLPQKTLNADGTVSASYLSSTAKSATSTITKAGTLERQVELLKFYCHPDYAPNQFAVCAALGAPLLFATGHHGVVVNMSGPPGASKSTTLYTGASLWGEPEKYCLNGTTRGISHNARDNRMAVNANLPQMVDEITRMLPRDAADLAMGVTQINGRITLTTNRDERRPLGENKSTILLCTANTSLYSLLATDRADSTAESVRVFEMQFNLNKFHTKVQADEYMYELKRNYGHIGEVFMSYVVQHREEVVTRVQQMVKAFDQAAGIEPSERFWSAAAAAALTACEIAQKLGLLYFKPKVIWEWLIKTQLPHMRGTMVDQYTPPVGVLSEYMELINGNMLVVSAAATRSHANISNVIRQPDKAQLLARYEVGPELMWLLKKSFRDYCIRYGHNFNRIIEQLTAHGIIAAPNDRKVLGAGTDYAKGQAWCIRVDMAHPDIKGEQFVPKNLAGKVLPFDMSSKIGAV